MPALISVSSAAATARMLTRAGAFRVYTDTSELRESLDELGLLS